jgi:hypothetical protein
MGTLAWLFGGVALWKWRQKGSREPDVEFIPQDDNQHARVHAVEVRWQWRCRISSMYPPIDKEHIWQWWAAGWSLVAPYRYPKPQPKVLADCLEGCDAAGRYGHAEITLMFHGNDLHCMFSLSTLF